MFENEESKKCIHDAIDKGIRAYFQESRRKVPQFVAEHYRYPGCWQTNRVAFGLDLLRSPLNIIWAPIYLLVQFLTFVFTRFSLPLAKQIENFSLWLPVGFTTRVQRHLNSKIAQELLSVEGIQHSVTQHVLAQLPDDVDHERRDLQALLSQGVKNALDELMNARTAAGDITNTLFMTFVGATVFKKFTPGGVGIGMLLAALWVEHQAKASFFLGGTLGGFYYSVFPPEPSVLQTALSIFLVMLALAVLASFSGLITDPLLARWGFHRRRLLRLIDHVEETLIHNHKRRFKTLDPYVARILELFDSLKSTLPL